MRRVLLIAALALLAFPAAAGAASVRLVECEPALEPADRSAMFEARVHAVHGSVRMQVRFTLQVRQSDLPGWQRVAAAEEWHTSFPGVRRYTYSRTVRNLSAPATYRTVVRFRWLDEDGDVVRRARAVSRSCRQPDLRPDLAVTGIVPVAGGYEVALRNRGRSAAAPFDVALAVGARALEPVAIDSLAAGEQRTVFFGGPQCSPGEPLAAVADVADAVDERDEEDNALTLACQP